MEYKGGVSHGRLLRGTDFLKASREERERGRSQAEEQNMQTYPDPAR